MFATTYISLLKSLIREYSPSGQEDVTATIIDEFLQSSKIKTVRLHNNVIAVNQGYNPKKKTILLNSHHDTVGINDGWSYDALGAAEDKGRLYGLGSNDAGASLVSLIAAFTHFYEQDLPFNLCLVASGEEENFGPNGLEAVLHETEFDFDFGIIGEPTSLEIGVAQKGLIVIDGKVEGKAGHAARDNGINAIYLGIQDIESIKGHRFSKISPSLGPTTAVVTQVNAGDKHNVIPDLFTYIIDVRVNEMYTLNEVYQELQSIVSGELHPRSLRWHSRGLSSDHIIYTIAKKHYIPTMGSPTLSDQVHCDFPTIKLGPGASSRSHTADEYIELTEIEGGIRNYIQLIDSLKSHTDQL